MYFYFLGSWKSTSLKNALKQKQICSRCSEDVLWTHLTCVSIKPCSQITDSFATLCRCSNCTRDYISHYTFRLYRSLCECMFTPQPFILLRWQTHLHVFNTQPYNLSNMLLNICRPAGFRHTVHSDRPPPVTCKWITSKPSLSHPITARNMCCWRYKFNELNYHEPGSIFSRIKERKDTNPFNELNRIYG